MATSVDPDQTAENDNQCRRWSDCWERQLVLALIKLLRMASSVECERMANRVDTDQIAETGK